jgi:hypothetical protein
MWSIWLRSFGMRPPAGDFDYEAGGAGYARIRQPDPRIESRVHAALGDARTVLNVGAGAGSYEPLDRHVVAVEPSAQMRSQRPRHLAPAVDATAERLPFDDGAFDASMAMITIHQWPELEQGLAELRRVTAGPVVVLTFDPTALPGFWLSEWARPFMEMEAKRMPPIDQVVASLAPAGGGGSADVQVVPLPLDCTDGFAESFYGRPEELLRDEVRRAQSAWGFLEPGEEQAIVERLGAALESGEWDERFAHLRTQPTYEGSVRLVISNP